MRLASTSTATTEVSHQLNENKKDDVENETVIVRNSADRDREIIQNNQKVTIIHNFIGTFHN